MKTKKFNKKFIDIFLYFKFQDLSGEDGYRISNEK